LAQVWPNNSVLRQRSPLLGRITTMSLQWFSGRAAKGGGLIAILKEPINFLLPHSRPSG
jgi:hypothetical protein